MWLIVVGILILFCIIRFLSDLSNTSESSTPASTSPRTLSVQVSPTKPFNPENPYEIYDVVHLLSAIVAEVGDSWLVVYLQDENPAKGWPRAMGLSVIIDNYYINRQEIDFSSYSGFLKLGLPLPAAKYLASVPFTVSGNELKYDFPVPLDYPSSYSRFIVEEMENGTGSSGYVQLGLHKITIKDNHGLIECKSD